ncbi:hypothetical protein [Paenibacillus sp. GYB003]|uniref:hypothetical protein n=1 Tax=Paenibacillus sp. GYB003 TaxID=2994392 RepID=UPI002F965B26
MKETAEGFLWEMLRLSDESHDQLLDLVGNYIEFLNANGLTKHFNQFLQDKAAAQITHK